MRRAVEGVVPRPDDRLRRPRTRRWKAHPKARRYRDRSPSLSSSINPSASSAPFNIPPPCTETERMPNSRPTASSPLPKIGRIVDDNIGNMLLAQMGKILLRRIPPHDNENIVAPQKRGGKVDVGLRIGHDKHPLRAAFADEYGRFIGCDGVSIRLEFFRGISHGRYSSRTSSIRIQFTADGGIDM